MKIQEPPTKHFDQEHASSYDKRWAKLAPTRDAVHLLIHSILSKLPANARILCVGAGTGSELLYLAQKFPQWEFTAVDPAPAMLEICRQRAEEAGITSRCTFHDGYLDSLPASAPFDAATSLLVSHFLVREEERREFFRQIAARLHPQGYLISSDIASDRTAATYGSLLETWQQMMQFTGASEEQVKKIPDSFGRDVAVLPPSAVESIIVSGGFEAPVLFFQSLLIHGWYARRA